VTDDAPLIATPRGYPLYCRTDDGRMTYFVVGWTSSGAPVGIPYRRGELACPSADGAREIAGEMVYEIPSTMVEGNGMGGVITARKGDH
jgi:hypothetical protein